LLFLLYKRKFKASVLFGLIFVLISLVFVVSHLTVPVEQNSVGGYGEISANILTQVFSNSIKMGDVFLQFFSINSSVAYIFFVPLLCFLGLFWITKKEKNFLKLLIISAVLFLFVNSVISARPTFTGITRYFIPIYSLLCIFAGIQLKKISLLNNKLISIFSGVLFISLILFISIFSLTIFNEELNSKKSFSYSKGIEDDSELVIWFVDGGALSSGFSKSTLYDYSWETDFSGNPCQFLKNNSIDYVVYFHFPIEDLYTNYLGDFGPKLRQSLLDDNCSVKVSKTNDIFKINYENEN